MRPRGVAAFIVLGLSAGVAVTHHAHRVPASPWWDRPAGRSRLRRSDLPVGDGAALLVAAVLRGTGQRRAALALAASDVIKIGVARRYPSSVSSQRSRHIVTLSDANAGEGRARSRLICAPMWPWGGLVCRHPNG